MKRTFWSLLLATAALAATAQNPYLPLWEHIPDGEPRVFEDPDQPGSYRVYLIGSHDLTYTAYCGNDVRMWSAPVEDLTQWRDEGPIFTHYVDGQWDTMYAPDLVEVRDKTTGKKTYYLYPHIHQNSRIAAVCKSDRPDGPFVPVNLTEDGRNCVPGSLIGFDPSVFVEQITDPADPDFDRGFRAYVFYGFQHSTAYQLDPDNMYALRPGTGVFDYFLPASNQNGEILAPEGTTYPALYKDQDPHDFNFFEASSIRQVGNKYVMVFSGYSGPEYGLSNSNSTLRYAFGDTPMGPWRSGGVLVDSRGVVPDARGEHLTTTNFGHNTHGSLQEINGQWYVFYHRPPRGFGYARQAMVAPVKIEWDEQPVAEGGMVRISAYDPYAKEKTWRAAAADGSVYPGAEVTSEGFQIYGLPPYAYYSAGLAAYVSGNDWMQDNFDIWDNGMELAGITNGGVVGFKYFGFEGLKSAPAGLRPFAGTKKGDGTELHLRLTPSGRGAFRIHVMLDGPYANETWHGREIAVIEVPADAPRTATTFTAAVPAVEGLKGKHALYLVAEGPEVEQPDAGRRRFFPMQPMRPQGLFDLHGLGFSKRGESCEPPVVPTVTICVDGQPLRIPSTPLRSSNANGYTDASRYQLYAPMTAASVVEATASDPGVQIEVGAIADGRATVRCTWNGQQKLYLIN